LEEPASNFGRDPRAGIANPDRYGAAVGNRRNRDGSPIWQDLQSVHKQIHQNTADPTPIQSNDEAPGYDLYDVYGLKFRTRGDLVHRARDQRANIRVFYFVLRISAPVQELLEQFAHSDRGAIHVACQAMDLRMGESRSDEHLRTAVNRGQWIPQIMDDCRVCK
jgi:hypothetical protein